MTRVHVAASFQLAVFTKNTTSCRFFFADLRRLVISRPSGPNAGWRSTVAASFQLAVFRAGFHKLETRGHEVGAFGNVNRSTPPRGMTT